jgi:membrane peptidoglycan carboxypeptidase
MLRRTIFRPESPVYDAPRPERASSREPFLRTSPSAAGWIALVIWAVFGILAVLGTVGVVAAFSRYTQDLTPPTELLKDLSFSEQSRIVDRNGVELARFGGEKREVVAFEDIPPIVVDAQVAIEDKTFWDNAGFDPVAIIAAGIDSIRAAVAAPRRSPSSSSASGSSSRTSSRTRSARWSGSSRRSSSRSG